MKISNDFITSFSEVWSKLAETRTLNLQVSTNTQTLVVHP